MLGSGGCRGDQNEGRCLGCLGSLKEGAHARQQLLVFLQADIVKDKEPQVVSQLRKS